MLCVHDPNRIMNKVLRAASAHRRAIRFTTHEICIIIIFFLFVVIRLFCEMRTLQIAQTDSQTQRQFRRRIHNNNKESNYISVFPSTLFIHWRNGKFVFFFCLDSRRFFYICICHHAKWFSRTQMSIEIQINRLIERATVLHAFCWYRWPVVCWVEAPKIEKRKVNVT